MLSNDQVDLIRESAERLAAANVSATNAFYSNLFKAAPGIRSLFPDAMFEQSEKLWQSIVMVVESADDLTQIENELRDLGARHVNYGAEPAHYPVVTAVLIDTVAALMQAEWTAAHQEAWEAAMGSVCALMMEGSRRSAA